MQRKLASIQRVLSISPIANADAIELVKINGWQCVAKKGEFQVGDLGLYFEIDSIPPDVQPCRFLWQPKPKLDSSGVAIPAEPIARPEKFRIRTLKLRGELSQGLLMPLAEFGLSGVVEGQDLTETLGVAKYEPPPPEGMGEFRAFYPSFIPKTDEIRVQSEPRVLDELRGQPYVSTQKYDGTSSTFCIDPRDGSFHACGRNLSISPGDNLYWRAARKYDLEAKLRRHPHMVVQGEIVGPGVQKNRLGLKETSLFAFSVFDIAAARFLDHDAARSFLATIDIPAVDVIEEGDSFQHTQASLLALAEGLYPGTRNEREGIVIRPRTEMTSSCLLGRLSFKAISNRFLLKEGE